MKELPKILIGVPCIDGSIPIEMVTAILSMKGNGTKFQVGYAFIKRAMIHLARNAILREGVEGGYDYVFYWDNDNPPERADFLEILLDDIEQSNGKVQIVSGVYRMRQKPFKLCIFDEYQEEGGFVNYKNMEKIDTRAGDIIEVGNIPTGCVLMSRKVCETMLNEYQKEPFECKNVTYVKHMGQREEFDIKRISEYSKNTGEEGLVYAVMQRGEDLLFFERCKTQGYRLYIDARINMGHLTDPENVPVGEDTYIR